MAGAMDAGSRLATVFSQANQSNGTATVTISAKPNLRFIVCSVSVSADGIPAAAVEFTLKDGSGNYMEAFRIPAAAFSAIVINYGAHPLMGATNSTVVATLPGLGAGITGQVVVKGFFATA